MIALPWAKIVDIAMFKFNSALSFTRKAPLKDARAHVHDAPYHLVSFTIDITTLMALNRCTKFHVASTKYLEMR